MWTLKANGLRFKDKSSRDVEKPEDRGRSVEQRFGVRRSKDPWEVD